MIKISNLSYKYKNNYQYSLKDINLIFQENKINVILGNNGSGKTTLFKCITRLLKFDEGIILIDGRSVDLLNRNNRAKLISNVFQESSLTSLSVYDSILLGRIPYINFNYKRHDYEIVDNLIKRFHLEEKSNKLFDNLSGGEKQIVNIARSLACESKYLIFDEPSSNLDIHNKTMLFEIINNLKKENKTILISLHDLNDAISLGDHFYILSKGRLLFNGDKRIINKENIKKAYDVNVKIETVDKKEIILYE